MKEINRCMYLYIYVYVCCWFNFYKVKIIFFSSEKRKGNCNNAATVLHILEKWKKYFEHCSNSVRKLSPILQNKAPSIFFFLPDDCSISFSGKKTWRVCESAFKKKYTYARTHEITCAHRRHRIYFNLMPKRTRWSIVVTRFNDATGVHVRARKCFILLIDCWLH